MVLENVTLFEVHLDDAQFTADAGGSSALDEATTGREASDAGEPVEEDGSETTQAFVDDSTDRDADESPEVDATARRVRGRIAKLAITGITVSVVAIVARRRLAGRDSESVPVEMESDPETGSDRYDTMDHEEMAANDPASDATDA